MYFRKKVRFKFIAVLLMMVFIMGNGNFNVYAESDEVVHYLPTSHGVTLSNNNLTVTFKFPVTSRANKGKTSGKWYWEVSVDSSDWSDNETPMCVGIGNKNTSNLECIGVRSNAVTSRCYYSYGNSSNKTGEKFPGNQNSIRSPYGEMFFVNDVIGVGLDMDNYTLEFFRNGKSLGIAFNDLKSLGEVYPMLSYGSSAGTSQVTTNFGRKPFKYPIPKGFKPYDQIEIDAPTNLTATANVDNIVLKWDEVNGVERYIVKRSITEGGPYETVGNSVYSEYIDTKDLDAGVTYYYVVLAANEDNESKNSNEASATLKKSGGSGETGHISGDRALVVITMTNSNENEYDLSASEVNEFISWYNKRSSGSGNAYYIINKDFNKGPFKSRKDYIAFDKISQFEVMEY
ncbi:SPRY domain-containing protein [Crassaminicella profunda]|uniref:SPRY domain-containing protein n=1 Tax=Crassaminicella profunda TaxID=1286698 RepID=UPI001CA6E609|nr:SPRY domain-containing protein [Crassaminicella profunda]QZY56729.1 hypothetical protein K7H06_07350 [Crassaminicella profunda]